MKSVEISMVAFACMFGGAMLGMYLRTRVPEDHLSAESKGSVSVGIGIIGTMAGLVLGLLVASAVGFYASQKHELTAISAKFLMMDRLLAYYGPEAWPARVALRDRVTDTLARLWPNERPGQKPLPPDVSASDALYENLRRLAPQNDSQRSLKASAWNVGLDIANTRWLMFEQQSFPIPKKLLAVVVFWFMVVFASFGLHAPRNSTVIITFFLCAVSVATAILLILELYNPFSGLIHLPSDPLRDTLAQLGR